MPGGRGKGHGGGSERCRDGGAMSWGHLGSRLAMGEVALRAANAAPGSSAAIWDGGTGGVVTSLAWWHPQNVLELSWAQELGRMGRAVSPEEATEVLGGLGRAEVSHLEKGRIQGHPRAPSSA